MRYVVKLKVYMALLAKGEPHPVAFYKYGPPGGGRKDRSVSAEVRLTPRLSLPCIRPLKINVYICSEPVTD
jgi:hypothetical protein